MNANEGLASGAAGRLLAFGGLTDRSRERELLRAFVAAAGGPGARLVVLALSSEPVEIREMTGAAERLGDVFYDLGARSVEVLRLGTAAGRPRLDPLDDLNEATGLFLTGGGPWLPLPDGLLLGEIVRRRHRAGLVVGGTGAGAALLPALAIAPAAGSPSGSAAIGGSGRRRGLRLAPGFGLAPGLLLDSIPRQRDRLSRLLTALDLAADPTTLETSLAVGIDDDTAVVIDPVENTLEVLGVSAVMVVDAAEAVLVGSNGDGGGNGGDAPPSLGLRVDLLTAGCRYDLSSRQSRPGTVHGAHGFSLWAPETRKPQGE